MNQIDYDIKKVDWELYLERQHQLFLFASFIRPYGVLLKEATDFEFTHQLHLYKNDTCVLYKSAEDFKKADAHFLNLVHNNDSRLLEWRNKGLEVQKTAEVLIEKYSNSHSFEDLNYVELQKDFEDILLYDTTIPYRVLSGINSAIEQGKQSDQFSQYLEMFEPFRQRSRYPALMEQVFNGLWSYIAHKLNWDDSSLLSYSTSNELQAFFCDGIPLDNELLNRRKTCAFWEHPHTREIVFSYDPEVISFVESLSMPNVDVHVLKGSSAYIGTVQGTVRIVNHPSDIEKVLEGDILVSINTNPSLVPAIKKCAGIISDEGGIMCHAAIVSREFKRPCIIGTKIATKVLKDGDMVEINADEGIVTIL